MKTIIVRSAVIGAALLGSFVVFSPSASIAEPLFSQFQSQEQQSKENLAAGSLGKAKSESRLKRTLSPTLSGVIENEKNFLPAQQYVATAYSLRGRTASGRMVTKGLIAADPSLLPLGSRVRLESSAGYSGEYLVADTGGAIRGRRIDIWTPSTSEAMRFGRRTVKLTVLSYGGKRARRIAKL